MKPLAAHGGAAADLIWTCAAAWGVFELVLAVRAGRGGGRDRSFYSADGVDRGGTCAGGGGLQGRAGTGAAGSRMVAGRGGSRRLRPRSGVPGVGGPRAGALLQVHGRRPARPRGRRHRPVPPDQAPQLHRVADRRARSWNRARHLALDPGLRAAAPDRLRRPPAQRGTRAGARAGRALPRVHGADEEAHSPGLVSAWITPRLPVMMRTGPE